MLTMSAPAKINLTLEVLGRRPDGYHEIASVLQTLELADTLQLSPAPVLEFTCSVAGLTSPDNLVLRAARLLQRTIGRTPGARIRLEKHVPLAAGLGGGSSDAAAALRGLDQLWNLGLPQPRLLELAAELGSDVPFFLLAGTALARGRGERLEPLPPLPPTWVVLAVPPLEIPGKTAALYARLEPRDYHDGRATAQLEERLRSGGALEGDLLVNSFERVALATYPEIAEHRRLLLAAGAPFVRLCGSGPALFSLFAGLEPASEVAAGLQRQGVRAYLTRTWNP